ncbi:DUF1353 domain-containing protein [Oerskovia sp. M15]
MPFLAPVPGDPDRWTTATTVDLRQLPVTGRWKVYFEVLTEFGHTSRPADEQSPDGPVWRRAAVEQIVPRGLVTDLASVPMPLWGVIASYGRQTLPAILHDAASRALAESGRPASAARADRGAADLLFRETLTLSGTGPVRRWLMWAAVRLFGHVPVAITFLLAVVAGLVALLLGAAGPACRGHEHRSRRCGGRDRAARPGRRAGRREPPTEHGGRPGGRPAPSEACSARPGSGSSHCPCCSL